MPMHDMECGKCGARKNDVWLSSAAVEVECSCGGSFRVVYDWKRSPAGFVPYTEENLGDRPIRIESNKQLADECRKRGLWAKRLDGGYASY